MPFTLMMPKMSPTMEEGTITEWHKKEGDRVEAGDLLFDIATDKATVEYNALDEGWLRKILIKAGQEGKINQPVAIFSEEQNENIEGYQPEGLSIEPKKEQPKTTQAKPEETASATIPVPSAVEPKGERILASPLAKKIAANRGIDLGTVQGTGPRGRIMSRDLDQASTTAKPKPTVPAGSFVEESLSPMRKAISKRLQEAKATIPHFYVTIKVDATALLVAREQLKSFGIKATYNDFIVCACSLALKDHPNINSGFNSANNSLIRFKSIDISVAVTIPGGLITPIVKHADHKSLLEISNEIKSLSAKAKEGKLQEDEYKGGSFTVSNMGMYGVSDFIAIINPPQAAILAVSSILEVPVVRNGQVVPGNELALTLSGDHRVIDGVSAAEFLDTLKKYLENPARLLVS